MSRTELSSTPITVAPGDGGRTTRPCSMPGTRTLWTNSNCPVAMARMSTRGTDVPSTVHSRGCLRVAFGSSWTSNFLPPTSAP